MRLTIFPSHARGKVLAPSSKSYAHRFLIAAALASGKSCITNISLSDDVLATLEALKVIGASYLIDDNLVIINGINKHIVSEEAVFHIKESGSTLRFMIPIALMLAKKCRFICSPTLIKRGIEVYEDLFKLQGIKYQITDDTISIEGALRAGEFKVKGNISSQFITGLLFSLPLQDEDSIIEIIEPVESLDYIKMTIDVLKQFGIEITFKNNFLYIKGHQSYKALNKAVVEADYSNAAFLDAFNYLDGNVKITNLNPSSIQGDKVYQSYFKMLDEENATINISNAVDLGPILMAMAALKKGATIKGTARLKIKESSRADAMKIELAKLGADILVLDDMVVVKKVPLHKPTMIIDSHNDHRIVMAMSVVLSIYGGTIDNYECVNKSFPTFFEILEKLGIEVKYDTYKR